jgi:hypothetical protein
VSLPLLAGTCLRTCVCTHAAADMQQWAFNSCTVSRHGGCQPMPMCTSASSCCCAAASRNIIAHTKASLQLRHYWSGRQRVVSAFAWQHCQAVAGGGCWVVSSRGRVAYQLPPQLKASKHCRTHEAVGASCAVGHSRKFSSCRAAPVCLLPVARYSCPSCSHVL